MEKKELSDDTIDYEVLLSHIYGNGLYQILISIVLSITSFKNAFDFQTMVFMHYTPAFQCIDTNLRNVTDIIWLSHPIKRPYEIHSLIDAWNDTNHNSSASEQCYGLYRRSVYDMNYTYFECSKWAYDKTVMLETIVTKFNLVCREKYWISWIETAVLSLTAVGFIVASLSDIFGRKKLFLIMVVWEMLASLSLPFSPNIYILLILRSFRTFVVATNYLGMNMISELVPMTKRSFYGNNYWILWSVGYMLCPLMAYLLRDWYLLNLWSFIFFLPYLTYFYFLIESPRWLTIKGQYKKVLKIFKFMTKANKVTLTPNEYEIIEKYLFKFNMESKFIKQENFFNLFRHILLIKHLSILGLMQCAFALVYYALMINSQFITNNIFLNVFLMGLIELPTNFIAWKMSNYGRRNSIAILLIISGTTNLFTGIFKNNIIELKICLAILTKFTITIGYTMSLLYVNELFPTSIRTACLFSLLVISRAVSGLAPSINQLELVWQYLPYLIYCSTCLISSLLTCIILPETKNCPLAHVIEDSLTFYRGNEFMWSQEMRTKYKSEQSLNATNSELILLDKNQSK